MTRILVGRLVDYVKLDQVCRDGGVGALELVDCSRDVEAEVSGGSEQMIKGDRTQDIHLALCRTLN